MTSFRGIWIASSTRGLGVLSGSPFRCRSYCDHVGAPTCTRSNTFSASAAFLKCSCRHWQLRKELARGLGKWSLCGTKAWELHMGRRLLFDSLNAVFAHTSHTLQIEKGRKEKADSERKPVWQRARELVQGRKAMFCVETGPEGYRLKVIIYILDHCTYQACARLSPGKTDHCQDGHGLQPGVWLGSEAAQESAS